MYVVSVHCSVTRYRRSVQDHTNVSYYIGNESDYSDGPTPCDSVERILEAFHTYYIPTIIIVGLLGNLLSCAVFLNAYLRMRSSSYYLAALAMTDFAFLVALLFVWLDNELNWRVFNATGWCEIFVYMSAVCSSLSVWLIVAFTVERFIAVQYPLQRPQMCTVTRAKRIICSLTILAMIGHSYAFITAGIVEHSNNRYCELKEEYEDVMRIISTVDTIVSLIIPLVLIVIMNTMIMRNLLKFSRRFKQTPGASVASNHSKGPSDINLNQIPNKNSSHDGIMLGPLMGNGVGSQQSFHSSKNSHSQHSTASNGHVEMPGTATANITSPVQPSSSTACHLNYQVPEIGAKYITMGSSSRSLVSMKNQQNITKMLLLISTVFILLNLPSYGIRLCIFFLAFAKKEGPALLWCLQQFFMLLYYTNFSVNFLLYAMCGATFRRCLDQLLQKTLSRIFWITSFRFLGRQRRNSTIS